MNNGSENNSAEKRSPQHVAIIMDGNGRWAQARGEERLYGHVQGVESIRKAIRAAMEHGVKYLTLYAFSTENWGRPQEEIAGLMELLVKHTVRETPELKEQGVRIRFIGDPEGLSDEVRRSKAYAEDETEGNNRLILVIALNYSSRWELTRMAGELAAEASAGTVDPEKITADEVEKRLATAGIPDPDLIVRTGGEYRLSNFLLWQAAYSELYFTPVQWPDFDESEFAKAVEEYARRERRYGGVKSGQKPDENRKPQVG